jgi:hypothetical protein
MFRTVDLNQLTKVLSPSSRLLDRFATCRSCVPESSISHQSSQRFAADQQPMALEQLLARQRWTEIRVVLTNEVQNVARVDRRQPPVTFCLPRLPETNPEAPCRRNLAISRFTCR